MKTLNERRAARKAIADAAHARAEKEIRELGRALVCQWGRHDDCRGEDPAAFGAGCLCECHDPHSSKGN